MDKTTDQILFIINPISGVKNKDHLPYIIKTCLESKSLPYEIIYTEYAGHAAEITKKAVNDNITFIVAAGGDGTINEIATALVGSNSSLGIIPFGSGNGLARHLKIPLNTKKAVENICNLHVQSIDTCKFNGHSFFCTAGIGFDGIVSQEFAKKEKRGFQSYIKTCLQEIKKYRSKTYHITTDRVKISVKAFSITIANAAQFGNNAYISPKSSIIDGEIELCIIKPFPRRLFYLMALRLFTKSLISSKYTSYHTCSSLKIEVNTDEFMHLDGEAAGTVKSSEIKVLPSSLKIISSKKIKA